MLPLGHVVGPLRWRMAVLVMLRPHLGFWRVCGHRFSWNVSEPALDLAPLLAYLFEAVGRVCPTNQNLGHVACTIIRIPPGGRVG